MKKRLEVLNIWVDPVTREEAIQRVENFLKTGRRPHLVFAANPEKNFSVPRDPVLYRTFRDADLLLPDGIGIVLALRLLYGLRLERVPGSEFIFDICRLCARRGDGVFFYGAKEAVNRAAVEILARRFARLPIVGRSNGYVVEADMPALVDKINASGARVLFLALGSPMQERWLAQYAGQLKSVRVCQGVGGTLDTIAGTVKRAPEFWCRMNLEWFYRLVSQPSRIRRQRVLPVFALKVMGKALFGKK